MRMILRTVSILLLAASVGLACPDTDDSADGSVSDDTDVHEPGDVKLLPADFAGAPTELAGGRLSCLGDNAPDPAPDSVLQLTGYVRRLADPDDDDEATPAATVEVFSADGVSLATGFADPTKAGRVAISVPVSLEGWDGRALVTHDGYIDWWFEASRSVTDTAISGWAWLTTPEERDSLAADLGVVLEESKGVLVGAVHDCDAFGIEFAVITVDGELDRALFVEGFAPVDGRTFTSDTGRFVVPNVSPGLHLVEAWGRLEAGDDLTLLSVIEDVEIVAGAMAAVVMEPRVGVER